MRDQLKKAQDAEDKPAIIELSRRIVAIAPNDSDTWDMLAQTQLETEELDGFERTLDEWQKASGDRPQRSKISVPGSASSARIIGVLSNTGLRLSRPNRRELTWRPITTTWRNYAQRRRVGRTMRHT